MAEILVVDDNPGVTKVMSRLLTQAGHRVIACASGAEALKSLGIQPDDQSVEPPDLMILDIMMSQSDGYMVATVSREHPRTRDIPIIVVSALRQLSQIFTSKVRVDAFITKPFSSEDLVGTVARLLEKRGTRG